MEGSLSAGLRRSRRRAVGLGLLALLAAMAVALFSGDTPITPPALLEALRSRGEPGSERLLSIVLRIRAPRLALAAAAGAGLGLAGALLQCILANPLASPFTLGVSSAAGFGASLAIVAGRSFLGGGLGIVGNAFGFALAASLAVYALAATLGASPLLIVLAGMGLNFLFSSLTTLLYYFSSPEAVYRALFWTSGSLSGASWRLAATLGFVLAFSLLAARPLLYDLSLIAEGEREASVVGVDVRKVRLACLALASLLAAAAVSLVGVIGFIGLVAPHLCRMLGQDDPRSLVPLSAAAGGTLLVLADLAATRLAAPVILPIGAVTSLLGVAFLFALVLARKGRLWSLS